MPQDQNTMIIIGALVGLALLGGRKTQPVNGDAVSMVGPMPIYGAANQVLVKEPPDYQGQYGGPGYPDWVDPTLPVQQQVFVIPDIPVTFTSDGKEVPAYGEEQDLEDWGGNGSPTDAADVKAEYIALTGEYVGTGYIGGGDVMRSRGRGGIFDLPPVTWGGLVDDEDQDDAPADAAEVVIETNVAGAPGAEDPMETYQTGFGQYGGEE